MIHSRSFLRVRAALPRNGYVSREIVNSKGAPGVDSVNIGLTSSDRVTFAETLPRGLGSRRDVIQAEQQPGVSAGELLARAVIRYFRKETLYFCVGWVLERVVGREQESVDRRHIEGVTQKRGIEHPGARDVDIRPYIL